MAYFRGLGDGSVSDSKGRQGSDDESSTHLERVWYGSVERLEGWKAEGPKRRCSKMRRWRGERRESQSRGSRSMGLYPTTGCLGRPGSIHWDASHIQYVPSSLILHANPNSYPHNNHPGRSLRVWLQGANAIGICGPTIVAHLRLACLLSCKVCSILDPKGVTPSRSTGVSWCVVVISRPQSY